MTLDIPSPVWPRLFLVRHGETKWSITGQHTGRTDLDLTPAGEAGARALVPWLRGVPFTRILSSPRLRARRTCALAGFETDVEVDDDLAEWDYGAYEGLRSPDIRASRPGWTVFADGCPGGESPDQVSARVDRFLGRLEGVEGNIAVFSHGHFGAALAARWICLPILEGRRFSLRPGSLSLLGRNPKQPDVRLVDLWNAVPGGLPP